MSVGRFNGILTLHFSPQLAEWAEKFLAGELELTRSQVQVRSVLGVCSMQSIHLLPEGNGRPIHRPCGIGARACCAMG